MKKDYHDIFIGQKLYLKKKKPKGEVMIILSPQKSNEEVKGPEVVIGEGNSGGNQAEGGATGNTPVPVGNKVWIDHIVKAGESLWSISQLYDTKVEIIKMINKLPNDNIQEGQSLKILADKTSVNKGG